MTVVHLEYEGGYYPYSYEDEKGKLRGVFKELWDIVAEQKGLTLNITKLYNKTQLLQNVENNVTFTMIDSFAMSSNRFDVLLESTSFGYYVNNFYETARSADQETSELSFFTVFQWSTLLLIIVAFTIISILEYLMNRRQPDFTVLVIVRLIISVIFVLSLTIVVFYHSAGFRGNNFIVQQSTPTALENLLQYVKAGTRTILVEVKDLIPPKVTQELNAHRTGVVYQPENLRLFETLCDDHTTAALLNLNNLLEMGEVRPNCELVTLTVSPQTLTEWNSYNINVYNFGHLTPSYYLYALNADRKLIHYVNQVLLRLYDQDRFEGFWTFRHLRYLRDLPTNNTIVMDYKRTSLNFLRLSIIFYILIGLLLLSIIVFVCELIACFSVTRTTIRRAISR